MPYGPFERLNASANLTQAPDSMFAGKHAKAGRHCKRRTEQAIVPDRGRTPHIPIAIYAVLMQKNRKWSAGFEI
jgi:hypothetical protein